jgi:hypothetical protein
VPARFETEGLPVRSGEAEFVDQRHLRRPTALAAEANRFPLQTARDREVPDTDGAFAVKGLRVRHEAGLRRDCRTSLGGIRHVAAGGIASEMEERASAALTGQSARTHSEHGQVRPHRGYRSQTAQLNPEHGASCNHRDCDQRHEHPPLSRPPLRLRNERIERKRESEDVQRHNAIIASTRPTVKRYRSGSESAY